MTQSSVKPTNQPNKLKDLQSSASEPVRTYTAAKGQPYLLLGGTSIYRWLYSDAGSGAHKDVTWWRPNPSDPNVYTIGDYAQGNYEGPTGRTVTVTAVNDPDHTLLQPPVDYREVWNDHGSGGDHDGSLWYPVPPDDYVSIGFVGHSGYNKPQISNYRCIHVSQIQTGQAGNLIWNDAGSGANKNVSMYANSGVSGIFVAQGNYEPYSGTVYQLKISSDAS